MALVILKANSYSGVIRLKSWVSHGPIATAKSMFQIRNLAMAVLVTPRSFQVILE